MFGLRGLHPDREISGFETAFSEIAPRLVRRGHDVTMYCRNVATSPAQRLRCDEGVKLVHLPSPGGKNFSALSSTWLAVLHALATRRLDVWFFVNVGMGYQCAVARLSGRPVILSVDGLDWQRGKWGRIARGYFRSSARVASRVCTRLVTDAVAMQDYYRDRFDRESEMIAYGANVESSCEPHRIAPYGVGARDYYLIVSRLIPENSLEEMLRGFTRSRTTRTLLVVGGANYADAFHTRLRALAATDTRVRLVGQVTDQRTLKELWCNCYAYLHGHSVGGTNPALLRAMGYGSCVLALDTVFNREVLTDTGRYFARDHAAVAAAIDQVDAAPTIVDELRQRAPVRIRAHYDWDRVTDQYERLFQHVTAR